MKELITSRFDKSEFRIDAMSNHDEGDIDPHILNLINKLNESEDIMTIYSCEGHNEGDNAYLFFNVSDKGWDIFWLNVMPELSEKFCSNIPSVPNALYILDWKVYTKSNEYNAGITIDSTLLSVEHMFTWEHKKQKFWSIVEEVFLKYYK